MKKAVIRISGELLVEIFKDGDRQYTIESGLPEDARFIGATSAFDGKTADLCFESETFDDVDEGHECPIITPIMGTAE